MIACGWCGAGTSGNPCSGCGRDPHLAHAQRGRVAPTFDDRAARLADARKRLKDSGHAITVQSLAEVLGVDERTVRRWQQMSAK